MKNKTRSQLGMTLTEILITMAMAGVVLAGATGFLVEMAKGNYVLQQRIDQASEVRSFSQDLIYSASRADQVFLYRSLTTAEDWDAPSDQLTIVDGLHPAGDFVVFVYYEYPKPKAQLYHRIQKIVGYYLDAPAGGVGAIRKLTIDLSKNIITGAATLNDQVPAYDAANSRTMVEQVLINSRADPNHASTKTFSLNARGIFQSETVAEGLGRLFYYRDAQLSMMVAGQLFATRHVNDKNTYTDTFNFSITPRS